ncbi:MAG: hypothetical protein E7518_00130 [Ruminococcaceae bacterium]|nr:hypothetical protein [Oscillospiraceae bacterium]
MKVFNCSDPGENPLPFWMTEKAYSAEEGSKEENSMESNSMESNSMESNSVEESEKNEEPVEKAELPVFRYQQENFFPDFCQVRRI